MILLIPWARGGSFTDAFEHAFLATRSSSSAHYNLLQSTENRKEKISIAAPTCKFLNSTVHCCNNTVPTALNLLPRCLECNKQCRVPKRPRGSSRRFETVSVEGRGLLSRFLFRVKSRSRTDKLGSCDTVESLVTVVRICSRCVAGLSARLARAVVLWCIGRSRKHWKQGVFEGRLCGWRSEGAASGG